MTIAASSPTPETLQGPPDDQTVERMAGVIAQNVRSFRLRQGLSLDRLAQLSGTDRKTLAEIEAGSLHADIATLWTVAKALDIPFSGLLNSGHGTGTTVIRRAGSAPLASRDGLLTSRALFPFKGERQVEFYELRLSPGADEHADGHPPGTVENLLVARGSVEVTTGDGDYRLEEGDAILFEADVPHRYRHVGEGEAILYLVMSYLL
ncbi:helix-turn-helix domain-containing protein [Azospirillum thermophilum]|uniref:Transcriptional regulator n=1 Tax=Azospirillum thermophilum TaxID=2202148 RepID=A0A2S2CXL8_9PROT|nr:cupin domain-containing protein [Azospirillum thermophilum]AWK89155.1 transcriptional regulator [Azospirillum thermophilum]